MSKLYSILLTACLAISFAACSDDDCEALHLNDLAHYPNVLKGTFPTEDIVLNLGETLTITPELLHPEGAFYSWMINGEEVSKEQTFTYKIEKPCRADLSCVISNQYGKVEMNVRFSSKHDFSKGFFYLIANTVNFYDTEKGINYEDCYGSLNNGKKLNVDNPNAFSQDGKFYVLSNSNATNQDHLYVINAQTLFYEKSAIVSTHLHGMVSLNDQYALTGGEGIRRINLKTLNNTILTHSEQNLYNGIVYQEKLLVNDTYEASSKVKCYDMNELTAAGENEMPLPLESGPDIVQNRKTNFVQAKDGNVYTLESTDDGCSIVRINKDLSVQKTPVGFKPGKGPYWSSPTVGMAAAEEENAIYIPSDDHKIYKYVVGDPNSIKAPFIQEDKSGLPIASTLQLNQKTGELCVIYGEQWNHYKIVVYNKNGEAIHTIDCGEEAPTQILFND